MRSQQRGLVGSVGRRVGLSVSVELAAEFEVLSMCLFECLSEGFDLGSVLGLHSGDLSGEGDDDVVLSVPVGGGWIRGRSSPSALMLDLGPQLLVVVEERVGYAGFALDGLEGDGLAAFDQSFERRLGGLGL